MNAIKNKYLLVAFLLSISLTGLSLYHFYPLESTPGTLFFITVLCEFAFLILGPILFVFRISGFLKRENFFYIFLGVANIWLGILSLLLYFGGKVIELMVWAFLPNLLVGILLLIDVYWVRSRRANPKS